MSELEERADRAERLLVKSDYIINELRQRAERAEAIVRHLLPPETADAVLSDAAWKERL